MGEGSGVRTQRVEISDGEREAGSPDGAVHDKMAALTDRGRCV